MHGFMNVKLPNSIGSSSAQTSLKPAFHLHDLCKFSFNPTKDTVFSYNDNLFIFFLPRIFMYLRVVEKTDIQCVDKM
jgi:hypothetical protein